LYKQRNSRKFKFYHFLSYLPFYNPLRTGTA